MIKDPAGDLCGGAVDLRPGCSVFGIGIYDFAARNINNTNGNCVAVKIGNITDNYMSGREEFAYLDGTGFIPTNTRDEVVFFQYELDLVSLQELDLIGFVERHLDPVPDCSGIEVRKVDGREVKD